MPKYIKTTMKVTILISIITLSINLLVGQIATIQDEDGWTNVRNKPSKNSNSIYKINEGELFWYDFEYKYSESDWVEVYVPEDKFTLEGYKGNSIQGYIHKTRLHELDSLEEYGKNNLEFKYHISDFDSTGRNIIHESNMPSSLVNENYIWGTDGYLPHNQVDSISIQLNNVVIPIDSELYTDLFNVQLNFKIYKIKDYYVVHHMNSDGAGFYEIAWVIDELGILQRIVGTML